MDTSVFEDTPLSLYLQEIESSEGFSLKQDIRSQSRNAQGHSVNTRNRRQGRQLLPLALDSNGTSFLLQKKRFRALLKEAFRSKLSNQENLLFLEQFRYIFISSQLMESKVRIFNKRTLINKSEHSIKEARRMRILYDSGAWSILKVDDRYWAGRGGGCVVVLTAILSLNAKRQDILASVRKTCLSIVGCCILLYLFAYSRRKMLRRLRAKVIAHSSIFVEANYDFDRSLSKCLTLIQEVELLSNGYRPDLSSNSLPAGRIEASSSTSRVRTAKSLRSALCASLYLAMEALEDSINEVLPLCSMLDLSRYFDIYEVVDAQKEFGINIHEQNGEPYLTCNLSKQEYYGPEAANALLTNMRSEFNRMHCLRRTLICCLMVVSTSGECSSREFDTWGIVVDQLDQTSALIHQLSESLGRDNILYKTVREVGDGNGIELPNEVPHEISALLGAMQHIDSRIEVLKENIDYENNYELLGEDIKHLLKSWETGLQSIDKGHQSTAGASTSISSTRDTTPRLPTNAAAASFMEFDEQSMASTMVDDMELYDECGLASPRDVLYSKQEPSIFEAVAEMSSSKHNKHKGLTREQRIQKTNEARSLESNKQRSRDMTNDFISELGKVLQRRSTSI